MLYIKIKRKYLFFFRHNEICIKFVGLSFVMACSCTANSKFLSYIKHTENIKKRKENEARNLN